MSKRKRTEEEKREEQRENERRDFIHDNMNRPLRDALEEQFKSLGIAAWSDCCRSCLDNYVDDDDFEYREVGINFFGLFLSGMNVKSNVKKVCVYYQNFEYLQKNWNAECELIEKWCGVLGLTKNDYVVTQPTNEGKAIQIEFVNSLNLDLTYEEEKQAVLLYHFLKTFE